MKNWFNNLKNRLKARKTQTKMVKKKTIVLDNNLSYVDWIESLERQIMQTKIDYALGWIDTSSYQEKMEYFRNRIKDISDSYLAYMKKNRISIPKELAAQYC